MLKLVQQNAFKSRDCVFFLLANYPTRSSNASDNYYNFKVLASVNNMSYVKMNVFDHSKVARISNTTVDCYLYS